MTQDNRSTRDELARLMGWRLAPIGTLYKVRDPDEVCWIRDGGAWSPESEHPCPNTLGAADAAMPEGWRWTRSHDFWTAYRSVNDSFFARVPDTGDRKADLFSLALAALKAVTT